MSLLSPHVGVDIIIDFYVHYNWKYSTSLIAAAILAAILDFSLIAGLWNVYPRYF